MKRLIPVGALLIILCAVVAVAEDDAALKRSDMPEAVLKAFETSYPNTEPSEFGREVVDEDTLYSIETRIGDLEKDFMYLQDGTLLRTEEDMAIDSLPSVVSKSVKKVYPDGEIDEVDKITRGDMVEFVIKVEIAESEHELLISSDGEVLSSALVADGDDDENDEDETEDDEDDEEDDD